MRIGMMLGLALLVANTAQALPLRLLERTLRAPADDDNTPAAPASGQPTQYRVNDVPTGNKAVEATIGASIAEVLLSLMVSGVVIVVPSLLVALAIGGSDTMPLATFVYTAAVMSILAPLASSLAVWAVDRTLPGNASYGRILLFSYGLRLIAVLVALVIAGAIPTLGALPVAAVVLAPVVGAAGEVLAARTAPEAPRTGGVPVLNMAF